MLVQFPTILLLQSSVATFLFFLTTHYKEMYHHPTVHHHFHCLIQYSAAHLFVIKYEKFTYVDSCTVNVGSESLLKDLWC